MDPPYALHGPPRSMSCPYPAARSTAVREAMPPRRDDIWQRVDADAAIALVTILPLSLDNSDWRPAPSPRQTSPKHGRDGALDASQVPLPPSVAGSEHGSQDSRERSLDRVSIRRLLREAQVALPPSVMRSKDKDTASTLLIPEMEQRGTQSIQPPSKGEDHRPSPDQIPLPSSVADSDYGESSNHSRRTSLLSVGGQGAAENPEMDKPAAAMDVLRPHDADSRSFEEVMSLVECAFNERARNLGLQQVLLGLLTECGCQSRCLATQSYLYKGLVECFRHENKPAFATLFEQIEASKALPLSFSNGQRTTNETHQLQSMPWISTLPAQAQPGLLNLLNNLRTNPLFLAERISTLNNSQLKNLAKPHLPTGRSDSSTESSPSNRLDFRLLRPWMRTSSSGMDSLPQDPLRLMILNCFDATSNSGYSERQRLLDVWSTACARLIEDQRVGSNEFCYAVLEIFADLTPWELGPRLELFLMELMHTGRFITSPNGQYSGTKESPEPSESAISTFFDSAVDALLELVTNAAAFSVPKVSLDLIHATLQKLDDPQKIARARRFFVYTWYCNTFFSSALLYPERQHLLLNVHISLDIRQKLFRELASRFQKTVREVLDPRSSAQPATNAEAKVAKLLSIFDAQPAQDVELNSLPLERPYIVLFAEDVLSIAKALYPHDPSESTDKPVKSEPTSPPSSVTGSSTLTAGTAELRSGINSAFTPSLSGTSVTSHTLSSDFFIKSPDKSSDRGLAAWKSRPGTATSTDGQDDNTVHSFLSELWKLCASRRSSNSPLPTVESSMFFVEIPSGRLSFQTSRNSDGDLTIQAPIADISSDSLASKDTQIVMRALSKISSDREFHRHPAVLASLDVPSSLAVLFRLHLDQARCQHDYKSSFFWFHALRALTNLTSNPNASVLLDLCSCYVAATKSYSERSQRYQEWIHSLQSLSAAQTRRLQTSLGYGAGLRTKMWYVADVRHSDVYESTVNIIKALQSMFKSPEPERHGAVAWARQRLRVSWGHEKAQAQAFQLISAPNICGGPNKLTDNQSELTSQWLNRESIENFCGGEERMHRFCFEIQRCASKLVGASMSESPVLWSSPLFGGNDKRSKFLIGSNTKPRFEAGSSNAESSKTNHAGLQSTPAGLFSRKGGLGFAFDRASNPPGQDSLADPFTDKANHALAPVFFPISPNDNAHQAGVRPPGAFVDSLRQSVVALLMSDLGTELWGNGSETDGWMNHAKTPLSNAALSLNGDVPSLSLDTGVSIAADPDSLTFDFAEGYKKLLAIFKYSLDPQRKLQALYELSILAECQCVSASEASETIEAYNPNLDPSTSDLPSGLSRLVSQARGVPRTRLTRLQEVVANCNERRQTSQASAIHTATSMGSADANGLSDLLPGSYTSTPRDISNALAIVSRLFLDSRYRPATLFRDLQLIASFVPSQTLDQTPHGTVFWTVGLVAMGLKSETCRIMTRRATEIVEYHVNSGNQHNRFKEPARAPLTSLTTPSSDPHTIDTKPSLTPAELASTTLADAARFYLLSALEGEPAAARELALFYLTHTKPVRPAMLPLSRPGEVLKSISMLGGGSGGSSEKKNGHEGPAGVLDPPTFAIAYHWMEFAANAGDGDAQTFLEENRELAGGG